MTKKWRSKTMDYYEMLWMLQEFDAEDFAGLPTQGNSNMVARAWESLRGMAKRQALTLATNVEDVTLEELKRATPRSAENELLVLQAWIEVETALASLALEWPMLDLDLNFDTDEDDPETGEPIVNLPTWVSQLRQTYAAQYEPIRDKHVAAMESQERVMRTAHHYREMGTLADAAEWAHQRGLGDQPWTTETPLRQIVAAAAVMPTPDPSANRQTMLDQCLAYLWMDLEEEPGVETSMEALKEENREQWMLAFKDMKDSNELFEAVWSFLDVESQLS